MKKEFTVAELKEKAKAVFAAFPKQEQLYATLDGNIFLVKNHAQIHTGSQHVLAIDRPFSDKVTQIKVNDPITVPYSVPNPEHQDEIKKPEEKTWFNKIKK